MVFGFKYLYNTDLSANGIPKEEVVESAGIFLQETMFSSSLKDHVFLESKEPAGITNPATSSLLITFLKMYLYQLVLIIGIRICFQIPKHLPHQIHRKPESFEVLLTINPSAVLISMIVDLKIPIMFHF